MAPLSEAWEKPFAIVNRLILFFNKLATKFMDLNKNGRNGIHGSDRISFFLTRFPRSTMTRPCALYISAPLLSDRQCTLYLRTQLLSVYSFNQVQYLFLFSLIRTLRECTKKTIHVILSHKVLIFHHGSVAHGRVVLGSANQRSW